MATATHLYLTVAGSYSPTPLQVEGWQMGIRLTLQDTLSIGATGSFNPFPVTADTASGTSSHWTYETNWQTNWLSGSQFDPGDFLDTVAMPAIETFINSEAFSSKVRATEVKLYPIDSNGKAVRLPGDGSGRSARADFTTATGGSGSSSLAALEVAAVASWQTPATGRKGKGRIYLPAVGSTAFDGDGFFTSTFQGHVLDAAVDLLHAIEWESGVGKPRTAPIVTGAPWENYGKIISVSVGNVPDVQRRRRRSLTETRVAETL